METSDGARPFTEDQIIDVPRGQQAGVKTAELCRKHGISDATFYSWKSKYCRMAFSNVPLWVCAAAKLEGGRQPISVTPLPAVPPSLTVRFVRISHKSLSAMTSCSYYRSCEYKRCRSEPAQAFDALYAERHVTRAGLRIGLSRPAMSGALTRLRDLLEDELFVRTQLRPVGLSRMVVPRHRWVGGGDRHSDRSFHDPRGWPDPRRRHHRRSGFDCLAAPRVCAPCTGRPIHCLARAGRDGFLTPTDLPARRERNPGLRADHVRACTIRGAWRQERQRSAKSRGRGRGRRRLRYGVHPHRVRALRPR